MSSSLRIIALLPAALVLSISTPASAQITAFWQQNTITPAAIASDPVLANMQSWSLMATTTGNWAYAGMEAILPAGLTFYNPPLGGPTRPNPALVGAFPHLGFDTYVTAPGELGSGAPTIFGSFPDTAPGTADFGGKSGRFSVAWGDFVNDSPGTYEIARLTFALGIFPDVRNLTPPQTSPSLTMQETPDANTIIPDIPEPQAMGLILGAGLLALSRRRSMPRMAALFVIALLPFLSTSASAQITAFWQPNTITPQAIAADPALANMQSWSLMVTTTGDWASAGMEAVLPLGNVFYNPSTGGNTKPSAATIAMFPNVEFDTYVSSPLDEGGGVGAPVIIGFLGSQPGPGDFGGMSGRFSVRWGNLVVDPAGTFELARLTFGSNVMANVRTAPMVEPSYVSQVAPDSVTFIPAIPEPAAMGLVLASVWLMISRRQTRLARSFQCLALFGTMVVPLIATPASAQITAFWQPNTITPQAIAADPTLANMQSWSVWATTTGNWNAAGMYAVLPPGNTFYNPPSGGRTKPDAATIAMFPHAEFDTYMTAPGDQGGGVGAPVDLGALLGAGPSDLGETSGQINAAWGDLVNDPPGTYQIMRITFSASVLPNIFNDPPLFYSRTAQVDPDSTTIIPDIPEPGAMGLVLGALVLPRRALRVSRLFNPC